MVSTQDVQDFGHQGWLLVPALYSETEVAFYLEHYMYMHAQRTESLGEETPDQQAADPLRRFPRMGMMHRRDRLSAEWLVDPRLNTVLTALLGQEPYAVQTMLYFKPPRARGQALHQDQYYLQVQPGTCIAAWLALDDCDEDNGCLQVVPGTHNMPVLCPVAADTTVSFTDVTVPLPDSLRPIPMPMKAGDVLFFNGQLVHGSFPNRTTHRFRRSLIAHYIVGEATQVSRYYHPVLRMNGEPIDMGINEDGGPCGTWVATDPPSVELSGHVPAYGKAQVQ